jgi:hypothetical protein
MLLIWFTFEFVASKKIYKYMGFGMPFLILEGPLGLGVWGADFNGSEHWAFHSLRGNTWGFHEKDHGFPVFSFQIWVCLKIGSPNSNGLLVSSPLKWPWNGYTMVYRIFRHPSINKRCSCHHLSLSTEKTEKKMFHQPLVFYDCSLIHGIYRDAKGWDLQPPSSSHTK